MWLMIDGLWKPEREGLLEKLLSCVFETASYLAVIFHGLTRYTTVLRTGSRSHILSLFAPCLA